MKNLCHFGAAPPVVPKKQGRAGGSVWVRPCFLPLLMAFSSALLLRISCSLPLGLTPEDQDAPRWSRPVPQFASFLSGDYVFGCLLS